MTVSASGREILSLCDGSRSVEAVALALRGGFHLVIGLLGLVEPHARRGGVVLGGEVVRQEQDVHAARASDQAAAAVPVDHGRTAREAPVQLDRDVALGRLLDRLGLEHGGHRERVGPIARLTFRSPSSRPLAAG